MTTTENVKGDFYDITNNTGRPGVFGSKQIEPGGTETVWLDADGHARMQRIGYGVSLNDKVDSAYDLFGVNHKRDAEEPGISDAPVMFTRADISVNAGTHLASTQGVNVNAMNAAAAGAAGMTVEEAEKVNSDITGESRAIGDPAFPLTEEENTMSNNEPGKNAGGKELAKMQKEREQNAKDLPAQSPQLAAMNAASEKHYEEPEHATVKDENKANKAAEKKAPAKSDNKDESKDDSKSDGKSDTSKTTQDAPNTIGQTPADNTSTINSQITPGNVGQTPQTTDPSARPEKPSRNHPANVNMP